MNFSLLLPAGLFALGALLLPLLMHLQRRRETPPPRLFAALAFIDPQARPKRRVRLKDLPLLLLRLLLLAVLALLLAQPLLSGTPSVPWVLLWPGLSPAEAGAVDAKSELRWLAPGFPRVDAGWPEMFSEETHAVAANQAGTPASPASLLRQLAFERPREQPLEIRVPTMISGLDGAQLELGRPLHWTLLAADARAANAGRPADASAPREAAASDATVLAIDASRRTARPSAVADSGLRESDSGARPASAAPLQVALRIGSEASAASAPALAALDRHAQALGAAAPLRLIEAAEAPPTPPPDALLQLGDEPLPAAWQAWLERGGRVLQLVPAETAHADHEHPHSDSHSDHDHDHDHDHDGDGRPDHSDEAHSDAGLAQSDSTQSNSPLASAALARPSGAGAASDLGAVVLWRGARASLSTQRSGRGELRRLSCDLQPSCLPELLDPDFPQRLAGWLAALPAAPDRAAAAALRPAQSGPAPQPLGRPLGDGLIVLLVLLFAAERWLAASRRPA